MEEKEMYAELHNKNRIPIIVIFLCVLGIMSSVCKAIDMWGSVKVIPTYISYVMNVYLYVSLIKFAAHDYKDPKTVEKKPFKGIMFKFCMMQLIAIISFRMGNIMYLFLSGGALLLAYLMRGDLSNFNKNKKIIFIVLLFVVAAATIRVINPYGEELSVVKELYDNQSIIYALKSRVPEGSLIVRMAYGFDNFSQVLQWMIIGGAYLFRYKDVEKLYIDSTEKTVAE